MPKSTVRNAIRSVLATGVAIGLSLNAQAQSDTAAAPATSLGQLVVTGQNLEGLQPDAENKPVLTITREQIKASGLVSVGDILQQLTAAGSATNTAFNFGSTGETHVDLRNLGSQRVLVLVNGHRWVTGLDGTVDLNTIPVSIIQRIDVLKAGAAAAYGSGAVAGVINIITDRNFTGALASAYYGEYVEGSHRDGQTTQTHLTLGGGSANGHMIFDLSYYQQDPILGGDRPISSVPKYGTGVTRGSSSTNQGRFIIVDPNTGQVEDLTVKTGTPGTSPADFRAFNTITDKFNFAPANYLLTPSQRIGVFLQGDYALTPSVSFDGEVLYNNRQSNQRVGPSEFAIGAGGQKPIGISASNPFNPFGFDLTATGPNPTLQFLGRQFFEFGPRFFNETVNTYHLTGGFTGHFDAFARTFHWQAHYTYNHNDMTQTADGLINTNKLTNALGPISDCGPGTANPDCVPLDLFGGQFHGGTITPAMIDYITYTGTNLLEDSLRDYTASLTAPLATLPGGDATMTAGYEYREVDGKTVPDSLTAAGDSFGNMVTTASGRYHVNAGYLLAHVPLLADLPLAQSLNLDAGFRHASFNTFGGFNALEAGLNWRPTDTLLVRAHFSEDFDAPSIEDLFGTQNDTQVALSDPCSNFSQAGPAVAAACAAAGVPAGYSQNEPLIRSQTGANPALEPEQSISRTIGIAWTPDFAPRFALQADYWRYNLSGAITQLNAQEILDGCYRAGLSGFCSRVARASTGTITNINDLEANSGGILTDGIDLNADYQFAPTSFGTFALTWQATYVHRYEQALANFGAAGAAPTVIERAGREFGRMNAGFPHWKSNLLVNWAQGEWAVNWRLRYISAMMEACTDSLDGTPSSFTALGLCTNPDFANQSLSQNRLGGAVYNDVQANYNVPGTPLELTFGILNLFDKQPPVSRTAGDSFDRTIYPIPGRFPYVSIESRF